MALLGLYLSMLETEQERNRMSEVYEAYRNTCLFVAKSYLEDDDWLAEDAVHNAFLTLISEKQLLTLPDNRLKAIILTIVKRRAIDLFRQKTRNITENLDDIEFMPSKEESVELQISTSEEYEKLIQLISDLKEPYRSIMHLKYFAELSNTKIGEYLGITNRQVEVHVYNAKLMLRKAFNDEFFAHG